MWQACDKFKIGRGNAVLATELRPSGNRKHVQDIVRDEENEVLGSNMSTEKSAVDNGRTGGTGNDVNETSTIYIFVDSSGVNGGESEGQPDVSHVIASSANRRSRATIGRKAAKAAKLFSDKARSRLAVGTSISKSMSLRAAESARRTAILEENNPLLAFSSQGDLETQQDNDDRMEFIRLIRKTKLNALRARISAVSDALSAAIALTPDDDPNTASPDPDVELDT